MAGMVATTGFPHFSGVTHLPYPDFILILLGILFLVYAEIHYRFWKIRGRLYREMPEIVFDLPFRIRQGKPVPLFLFIKDAHRFPVHLTAVVLTLHRKGDSAFRYQESWTLQHPIETPFFSRVFWISPDRFPQPDTYWIEAKAVVVSRGKTYHIVRDNYTRLPDWPLQIAVEADALPTLPGWYWGDLHVHSLYTRDEIEFGAPLLETLLAARSLGLSFLAITDHSYDFRLPSGVDTVPESWKQFQQEVIRLNREFPDVCLLAGEEVSVGNTQGENVHCLVIGHGHFLPGFGDGSLKLWNNQPDLTLDELLQRVEGPGVFVAAAHPFDIPPRTHQWILNRGCWHLPDLMHPGIHSWQILNGMRSRAFYRGLTQWQHQLLNGRTISLIAGNDAHGNFNMSRHIRSPLWKMGLHRNQILGRMRTGVWLEPPLSPNRLLTALRRGQSVISSGPLLDIAVMSEGNTYRIGETVPEGGQKTLLIHARSAAEFGAIIRLILFFGDSVEHKEIPMELSFKPGLLEIEREIPYPISSKICYIRGELLTDNGTNEYFCYTNPLWVAGS